jgi:oligopeptidase B
MLSKRKLSSGLVWVVLFSLLFSWYCATTLAQNIAPPIAQKIPKVDTSFGDIRVDNYFWLRDKNNPEVIKYLQAENKYTETVMKPTEKLQEKLYKEMLSRIKETDMSVPEKIDDYYYYTREEKGKQYRIYCRKKGSLDAPEEILLDANELARGHNYLDVGVYKVSPDHQLLAYSIDTTGAEDFTIYFKDLNTGKTFDDVIPNTSYSAEWANDNKTVFYNTLDEAKRPYKLFRHTLRTDPKNDALVYHEKDEAFNLDLKKSKSKAYLFMLLESETTSEDWYLDASHPDEDFRIIQPRQHEMEYSVEQHGDKFYILTNDKAQNFKLMGTPITSPSKENWKVVIPASDSVKLDDIEVFKNHLVVYERERGVQKIRITNLTDNQNYYVDFPEPVYTFWPERNPDFNTNLLRFDYTSLITPRSIYDYNMDKKTRELKKQDEVLGGYKPSLYQEERIFARASDGTLVPISMVYKKGMTRNGKNPLFLYGYGAYGISSEPYFSSNRLSLLDRGFIYAIAHVRGGGEMGRYWYDQGKLLNKKNTFTDFVACAEHLIAEKYTSRDELVINGGSAGGLLMGAVTNMRPDLFRVVIANVPFVDLINTMLDPSLPLTVIEYEEWGNPHEKEYYGYMRSYSPYDNVQAKAYPNMLITTSLNDPRVSYWEPTKWTAKLRALKTDNNLLLFKINMDAGHGGSSGRYDYLKDIALEYAFIFKILGIKN